MDGKEEKHIQREEQPPQRGGYDVWWLRVSRATGLIMGFSEFVWANITHRDVNLNTLLFAAALIGVDLLFGKKSNGGG